MTLIEQNDKWFKKIISLVCPAEKPVPDFEKWQWEHPRAVEILRSQGEQFTSDVIKTPVTQQWRIIMESRITKFAAAAVIIIVAILVLQSNSIDIAGTAIAQMTNAIMKVPFVHITMIESRGAEQKYRREFWLYFETGIVDEIFDDGKVRFVDPKSGREYFYYPNSGKIIVTDIVHIEDQSQNTFLERMKSSDEMLSTIIGPLSGAEMVVEEGNYENIDVEIYKIELPEVSFGSSGRLKRKVEIAADTLTNLPVYADIQGINATGNLVFKKMVTFEYPEEFPTSIYELGVPESAELVEGHSDDVQAVLDRLDSRHENGFGDFVAVLTTSEVDDDGVLKKVSLELFSQRDENMLHASYPFRKEKGANWNPSSSMITVAGWPMPDVGELLELGRRILPGQAYVTDGTRAWRAYYWKHEPGLFEVEEIQDKEKVLSMRSVESLSRRIWPTHFRKRISYSGDGKVVSELTLLQDREKPQLVGLRLDQFGSVRGRWETIYWIDTARDDVPIELILRLYSESIPESVKLESYTRYIDYEQNRGNQWYPTHWQKKAIEGLETSPSPKITDYQLRIYPDMELDEWWFSDLVENLREQKGASSE